MLHITRIAPRPTERWVIWFYNRGQPCTRFGLIVEPCCAVNSSHLEHVCVKHSSVVTDCDFFDATCVWIGYLVRKFRLKCISVVVLGLLLPPMRTDMLMRYGWLGFRWGIMMCTVATFWHVGIEIKCIRMYLIANKQLPKSFGATFLAKRHCWKVKNVAWLG